MLWCEILLLAILQGIAEFLPISSSGHLAVVAALFDQFGHEIGEKLTLNIALHLGTLAAILVVYRRRIIRLLGQDRRVILLLLVGTVPAVVVGLTLKMLFRDSLESPLLAGCAFPLTGLMLLWALRARPGTLTCGKLGFGRAFLIGLFQAFAILPGISRSGATIVAGLALGLKREEAAVFSFLLAIPAIAGAGLLETYDVWRAGVPSISPAHLAVGMGVSFSVGLVSLLWLLRWLQRGHLHRFAWYLFLLGPCVVAWRLFFS